MQHGSVSLEKSIERQELDRLRGAIAASGDIIYDWDLETDEISWWGQVIDIFGMAGAAAVPTGSKFEEFVHPDDRLLRREQRERHITEGTVYDCEYRLRVDTGEYCWIHDRGSAALSARGRPVHFTGSLRVVTARKNAEATLEEKISFDELTGHFNRTRLRDALEHALVYGARYNTSGAFLAIGIDGLTQVNEIYGCDTADGVIIGVARRLDRYLRASDVIGRMEGDRFGLILSNCAERDVLSVAEKILTGVRETPIETERGPIQITVSIGGVSFPAAPGQVAQDIMRRADSALQEAKQLGRNCFVPYRYSEDQQRQRQQDMVIAKQVQEALKDGRLVFAYQPVVRAKDFSIAHYECLIRMIDEDGNIAPAGSFISIVERMGLIRTIDVRVLEMAIDMLMRRPEIILAINASGLTAGDRTWLRLLISRLKGYPQVAKRLIIEITETVALHDIEETANFVSTVRSLGCQVALDDFGAGYTSFRHLQALDVDMVKIDGSFIRDLDHDLDNQLFVKTLLSLAEGFGLRTVAECVETRAQANFLAQQGMDLLQGYYFGRPELKPSSELSLEDDQPEAVESAGAAQLSPSAA
ncbi:MAG: GGDEF and EAL domain-containing protein [Alphaproteobacteria bacterium]|nr:GGDEF and EAL domain-containing protein [Alphaproteobacteria bacterium]